MASSTEFEGKTVVITGAGGGLGTSLAAHFVAGGAEVIVCDTSVEALSAEGFAGRHAFELTDPASIAAAAQEIIKAHGVPDVLVNNAGWSRADTMGALTLDLIAKELDINLKGVMLFTDPIARAMAKRGGGSIVFVSSVNALAHFGNPAYSAAKAGINAYARSIAVEMGRSQVRANLVCPGSIRTPAWDRRIERDPAIMGKLKRLYPLGRIVDTSEVAEAVAFLASDRASGITGVELPVDAGLTAGQLPFIDDIFGE